MGIVGAFRRQKSQWVSLNYWWRTVESTSLLFLQDLQKLKTPLTSHNVVLQFRTGRSPIFRPLRALHSCETRVRNCLQSGLRRRQQRPSAALSLLSRTVVSWRPLLQEPRRRKQEEASLKRGIDDFAHCGGRTKQEFFWHSFVYHRSPDVFV